MIAPHAYWKSNYARTGQTFCYPVDYLIAKVEYVLIISISVYLRSKVLLYI